MQNSTELGYLIPKEVLNQGQVDLQSSSIRRLHQETVQQSPSVDLLTGPTSFGALMEAQGCRAFPSPRQPRPDQDKYYTGGFITRCHGSYHSCGNDAKDPPEATSCCPIFDAIQLETPRESRIDGGNQDMREFGKAIGKAIANFYKIHYSKTHLNMN